MTPIQNPVQQGQIPNYGEQKNKQNMILTTRAETSSQPIENNLVQIDSREADLQEENAPQHQIHYQKILNKDLMNKEEIIPQQ